MMNLRRGLFRLWIIGAALFVIAVASISYPGIKFEFHAVESKPEAVESEPEAGTPTVLAEFRQQYPQYSDMPREQFNKKVSEKIAASKTKMIKFRDQLYKFPADATEEEIATALKSTLKNPWARVGKAAWIAFGIPLAVLALGAFLVWVFSGLATTTRTS
jgi:hypothetical protein